MSEFEAVLRIQVEHAQRALDLAYRSGDEDQLHQHAARLLDLLERAGIYGVDTAEWVAPDALTLASTAAGDEA